MYMKPLASSSRTKQTVSKQPSKNQSDDFNKKSIMALFDIRTSIFCFAIFIKIKINEIKTYFYDNQNNMNLISL